MSLKKDLFAAEIKDGQEFCSPFLVKTARLADTKQGKPFLTLELMDSSGELVARVWDDAERLSSLCPPGAVLQVTAAALSYKGALQLKVSALERVEVAPEDWGLFVPAAPGDHRRLSEELVGLFREVADPDLRRLLLAVAGDQPLWRDFCAAPAAKSMHHAYLG
ncbi:MAG: OB-fold nucleic acid binding domain-containing protein, partial [Desulfobacteraceae bacterium]|nr:OB-fold nucleic acid binding domain-containing protein [Desulfobacteraceae bacterium]